MILTNEELKKIYFGAYSFDETDDGYLQAFQYSPEEIELAQIAGYMHDIGNAVNRHHHAEYGALLANEILKETDLSICCISF